MLKLWTGAQKYTVLRTSVSRQILFASARRTVKTSTVDWKPIKSTRSPNDEHDSRNASMKSKIGKFIFLSLMIAMPIVSFQLGLWQYKRLNWKNKLVSKCEERLISEPITDQNKLLATLFQSTDLEKLKECELEQFREFTDDINLIVDDHFQYKKIKLNGRFDHENELFVGPRIRDGNNGYVLFTPFVLESGKSGVSSDAQKFDGQRVLIERGWIAIDKVLPSKREIRHLSMPEGLTQLECVIKVSRNLSATQWERENKDGRLWQVIDFPEMCKEADVQIPILFQQLFDLKDHKFVTEYEDVSNENFDSKKSKWFKNPFSKGENLESGDSTTPNKPFVIKDMIEHADFDGKTNVEEEPEYSRFQFVNAGVPLGKNPKIEYKNDHFQYMVTWMGLSFLSSIFLFVALRKFRKPNVVSQDQLKRDKLKHANRFM